MNFYDIRELRHRALEMALDKTYIDPEGRVRHFCVADVIMIAEEFTKFMEDGSMVPECSERPPGDSQ